MKRTNGGKRYEKGIISFFNNFCVIFSIKLK